MVWVFLSYPDLHIKHNSFFWYHYYVQFHSVSPVVNSIHEARVFLAVLWLCDICIYVRGDHVKLEFVAYINTKQSSSVWIYLWQSSKHNKNCNRARLYSLWQMFYFSHQIDMWAPRPHSRKTCVCQCTRWCVCALSKSPDVAIGGGGVCDRPVPMHTQNTAKHGGL